MICTSLKVSLKTKANNRSDLAPQCANEKITAIGAT